MGFYIGGNVGGAWASGTVTDNLIGASFTGDTSGFTGGGQIGYNWQVAPQFVLGAEGMLDGTSISKSSNVVNISNGDALQGSARRRHSQHSSKRRVTIMTCEAVAHDGLLVVLQCAAINGSSSARYL